MAHSGTGRAGEEPPEPEQDSPLPPPFLLDGSELIVWSISPQLAILGTTVDHKGSYLKVVIHKKATLHLKVDTTSDSKEVLTVDSANTAFSSGVLLVLLTVRIRKQK